MQRNVVRQEYANFLRRLLYSIDHIDWRVNRSAQMTKLLCHLEKRHSSWPKDVEEEKKQVELAIDMFEKEQEEKQKILNEEKAKSHGNVKIVPSDNITSVTSKPIVETVDTDY